MNPSDLDTQERSESKESSPATVRESGRQSAVRVIRDVRTITGSRKSRSRLSQKSARLTGIDELEEAFDTELADEVVQARQLNNGVKAVARDGGVRR